MFKAGHGEWSEERENSCASSQLKVFILLNGWREKKKIGNRRSGTGWRSHTIHVPGCTYGISRLVDHMAGASQPVLDI